MADDKWSQLCLRVFTLQHAFVVSSGALVAEVSLQPKLLHCQMKCWLQLVLLVYMQRLVIPAV